MDQVQLQAFAYQVAEWTVNAVPNLIAAILIAAIGFFIAKWASRLVTRLLGERAHVDQTLTPVVATFARYFILIVAFVAALGQLGVQIASVLAVIGAAGLAIGLALQGTLSNIAAGLMLLWLRPFRAGEYIDAEGIAGTVVEVGLFATTLRTADGIYRFAPNSDLWNKPILNYSRNPTRRLDLTIGIDYDDDVAKARELLLGLAAADARVMPDPAPQVMIAQLADSSVNLTLRIWVATSDFWAVTWDMTEQAKHAIEASGLSIPFPQRVVRQQSAKAA